MQLKIVCYKTDCFLHILQKTFFKHALAGFHPLLIIFYNPAEALTDSVKSQAGIQK